MDAAQLQQVLQGLLTAQDQRDQAARVREDGHRAVRQNKHHVEVLVKQTPPCDGTTNAAVREWMRNIDLTETQIAAPQVIEIVSQTVTGPLRREIEHFLTTTAAADAVARNDIPWADVRAHVTAQFLSTDENAVLRNFVETKVLQRPNEPEHQFARRFRDAADDAYPRAQRNADQQRVLIKSFIRGLRDDRIARRLVEEHNPADIDTAITGLTQICTRAEAYERMGRPTTTHVPMEVDAVATNVAGTIIPVLTTLVEAVNALKRSVASSKQTVRPQNASNAGRGLPKWDEQGRPRCFECGVYGHMGKECRARTATPAATTASTPNAQPPVSKN